MLSRAWVHVLVTATAVSATVLAAGCAYDWTVGSGGGGAAGTSTQSSGSVVSTSTSASSSVASGGGCTDLVAQYDAALLAAKRCTMTDPTACQLAATDVCACKIFLAHAGSQEAADFDARKSALTSSGCALGCTTCPVGPVFGSCAVDIPHGGTSCTP